MSKIKEIEAIEKQIASDIKEAVEIADLRLATLGIEKTIISLIDNTRYVESTEKYISTVGSHMYYNKQEKKYMKIFDVREGKMTEIFNEICSSYISLPGLARNCERESSGQILIEALKTSYNLTKRALSKYVSGQNAYSYRGNSSNFSNSPRLSAKKEMEPNFAKFIVIIKWSVDDKGKIHHEMHIKSIRAEWFLANTKQNLSHSLFGTLYGSRNAWKVSKQTKELKKTFKTIKSALDKSLTYKSTDDTSLTEHIIFLLMNDYLEKISKTRTASSRFGL